MKPYTRSKIQISRVVGCPEHPVYPQSDVKNPENAHQNTQNLSNSQITRLAPSPTGMLHIGNAFAFVTNWALARKHNWHIILRIEDLDTDRVKKGLIDSTINTLQWLGLDWDSGPFVQSDRVEIYAKAMQKLAELGRVYPCQLSRSQIKAAASAPHPLDPASTETRYNPKLRPSSIPDSFNDSGANWRLIVPPDSIAFHDQHMGEQSFNIHRLIGDYVVWTKRNAPSYQLAVVVDDALSGVTQIVRGRDLLDSAARQRLLYDALSPDFPDWKVPIYTHLPLITDTQGRRLAKRHDDTRIDSLAQEGVTRERIIGLIAYWCGIRQERAEMSIEEFQERFELDTLGTDDIVFTPEDDAWLRA